MGSPPGRKTVYTLTLLVLTHAYLLISPFVYSGSMAIFLLPSLTPSSSGYYAGYISSSFMLGRSLSSYVWGKLSDIYGRKACLKICMLASAALSLAFGMSRTFAFALATRFILGLVNNIPTVTKCLVSELSDGDKKWE